MQCAEHKFVLTTHIKGTKKDISLPLFCEQLIILKEIIF